MHDDPSKFLSHRLHVLHHLLHLASALRIGRQDRLIFVCFLGQSVEDELIIADLAGVAVFILILSAAFAEHTVLVVLVPASTSKREDGLSTQIVSRGVSVWFFAFLELESVELATFVGLHRFHANVHGVT